MKYRIFNRKPVLNVLLIFCLVMVFALNVHAGPNLKDNKIRAKYVPGEVLVKFRKGVNVKEAKGISHKHAMTVKKRFKKLSQRWNRTYLHLKSDFTTDEMIRKLKKDPKVESVSPNYIRQLYVTFPDDASFNSLWGLNNTGQYVNGTTGTFDADIDAPEAWDTSTGSKDVVVAVIDTGVDYSHEDLSANMWTNTAERNGAQGIDDDGNGYVDDIFGYDFASDNIGNDDLDPMDIDGHGTHVSGTIGAVGNNSIGVAGVNWDVKIMAIKTARPNGGFVIDSDVLDAIDYILTMKTEFDVDIAAINASWGGIGYNPLLKDAIKSAGDAGIAFIAAAGNSAIDNDLLPHYPSSYRLPNLISVAAIDQNNDIAYFSNYGAGEVSLGAPGSNIYSTYLGGGYTPVSSDIFFDDMESGDGNWIQGGVGDYWQISTESYHSTNHAWSDSVGRNYYNNTDSYLAVNHDIDLSGTRGQDIRIGFSAEIELETSWDFMFLEVSNDSGSTWKVLASFSENSPGWDTYAFYIPERYRTSQFRFRFRLLTDYVYGYDGVHIDDVGIGLGVGNSDNYTYLNGTSMAAPHVTGSVALMASRYPADNMYERINRILSGTQYLGSLDGKVATEGILNIAGSIDPDRVQHPYIINISESEGTVENKEFTLTGIEFGEIQGQVVFTNGTNEIQADIDSWSDTTITAKVPQNAYRFVKVIRSDNYSSNILTVSAWMMKQPPNTSRTDAAAVAYNNKIYLFGGDTNGPYESGGITDTCEIYDCATNTWSDMPSMPISGYGLAAAELDGEIYIAGNGVNFHAYNTLSDTWSVKADCPVYYSLPGLVSLNEKIYYAGGFFNGGRDVLFEYTPDTDTWTQKASMNTRRWGHGTVELNGKIYVFGGLSGYDNYSYTYLQSAEVYDPAADAWSNIANMPVRLHYVSVTTDGEKIYIAGGKHNSTRIFCNIFMIYDPASNTWQYEEKSIKNLIYPKFSAPLVYLPAFGFYSVTGYGNRDVHDELAFLLKKSVEDNDGEGLPDALEADGCTDPFDADTDDDGLSDGAEDVNRNGLLDSGETDPCNIDTDEDGIQDGTEQGVIVPVIDPDGEGPLLGTDTGIFIPDSDPLTMTDPLDNDSDNDNALDGVEDTNQNGRVDADETDPGNGTSVPPLIINLKKGLNIVAIHSQGMLNDWLPVFGNASEIEKIMFYDIHAGKFITLIPGSFFIDSPELLGNEGFVVYAKKEIQIGLMSKVCSSLNLHSGLNLVAMCPTDNYSAYDFLGNFGEENITSIQKYSTDTGMFESAWFDTEGQVTGVDFEINPGEGYFVYKR